MTFYLRLALRNVFRSRTRSAITLAAIVFGCVSIIFAGGFIEDSLYQLRESYIRSQFGHLQVTKRGFFDKGASRPFDFMISDSEEILKLVSSVKHVQYATPRLEFSGLLSNGDTTTAFIGQGVDPRGEAPISTFMGMDAGRNLREGDEHNVIVGRGLAGSIAAKEGDQLVVVANTKAGAINAADVSVSGVFYTSSKPFDDRALRMPIRTAQRLLHLDNVQTIVVLLDDTDNTDRVAREMEGLFKRRGLDLEIKAWYQMADFYTKLVNLYNRQFGILKLIIAIVVILSVFNTMNMSVLERIGEIGTIMALGTKSWRVIGLFMAEGLMLGVIGGLLGLGAGYCVARATSYVGIPMPPPPGATIAWTAQIRAIPSLYVYAFCLAVVTALVSSFYPAFKASRLEIAEALRHNV